MPLRLDLQPGTEYLLPLAKKKLEELRGLDILSRVINVSSGEQIFVQKGFVDLIRIRGGGALYSLSMPENGDAASALQFAHMDLSVITNLAALYALFNLPVPDVIPPPFGLAVRGGQIVKVAAADTIKLRIALAKKFVAAKQYDLAENMLRYLEAETAGTSTPVDAALNCDEGFFVDSAMYAGKSYQADIQKAFKDFDVGFSHVPAPDPTADLHPEINLTTYNTATFPLYSGYAPRQWSYMNAGAEVIVAGAEYVGAGGALSQPERMVATGTPAHPDVGTVLTHKRAELPNTEISEHNFRNTFKERDILQIVRVHYAEDNYTVSTSSASGSGGVWVVLAEHKLYSDNTFGVYVNNGPISGYASPRARRWKMRRTPTGWIVALDARVAAGADVMPFTINGGGAAGDITPQMIVAPSGSAEVPTVFEDAAGNTHNYAIQSWQASDVSAAADDYPGGLSASYLLSEWATPRGGFGIVGQFYRIVTPLPTFTTGASGLVRKSYSAGTVEFAAMLDGSLRITDSSVTPPDVKIVPAPAGATPERVAAVENVEYAYADVPSVVTARNQGHVNVSLQAFHPAAVYTPTVVPPSNATNDFNCIYVPATGDYLFFRQNRDTFTGDDFDATWQTATLGLLFSIALGADAAVRKTYSDQIQSLVTVLLNTGLSTDLIAMWGGGVSATTLLV